MFLLGERFECYIITYHIVHFVEGFVEINIQAARRALREAPMAFI